LCLRDTQAFNEFEASRRGHQQLYELLGHFRFESFRMSFVETLDVCDHTTVLAPFVDEGFTAGPRLVMMSRLQLASGQCITAGVEHGVFSKRIASAANTCATPIKVNEVEIKAERTLRFISLLSSRRSAYRVISGSRVRGTTAVMITNSSVFPLVVGEGLQPVAQGLKIAATRGHVLRLQSVLRLSRTR
jgi:hypothetical protein